MPGEAVRFSLTLLRQYANAALSIPLGHSEWCSRVDQPIPKGSPALYIQMPVSWVFCQLFIVVDRSRLPSLCALVHVLALPCGVVVVLLCSAGEKMARQECDCGFTREELIAKQELFNAQVRDRRSTLNEMPSQAREFVGIEFRQVFRADSWDRPRCVENGRVIEEHLLQAQVLAASRGSNSSSRKTFRGGVCLLYGDKCVVSGASNWQAAHVLPQGATSDDRLRFSNVVIDDSYNGIPLRSDLHGLFDTDRLGFFHTSGELYNVCYFGADSTYFNLNTTPPKQVRLLADQNVLQWRYLKCVAVANVPKVRAPAPKKGSKRPPSSSDEEGNSDSPAKKKRRTAHSARSAPRTTKGAKDGKGGKSSYGKAMANAKRLTCFNVALSSMQHAEEQRPFPAVDVASWDIRVNQERGGKGDGVTASI